MAANTTGLPTEEEVDKMKSGKLTRLLLEFGMTSEEIDDLDKEEAREELKKRIRDIRAAAATSRRPGQIGEELQQALLENREKRQGLATICNLVSMFVVYMDDDDKRKMSAHDVFGQDVQKVLDYVRTFLQNDNCPILVIGETSSGKSSLLNLLLGDNIVPVSHLACTSTLCFVRHGEEKRATVYLKGSNPIVIDLEDADRTEKELAFYVHRWGREDAKEVEKVVIQWPLESLQGGICIVDGPGIMTERKMDEVVARAVSSTCAFIYMINSAIPLKPAQSFRGEGERADEHTDGLSHLLKWCQKHKWGGVFDMSLFDLESTIFVCNKWDSVQQEEREVVKEDYLNTLRGHFPELRDDQVFFLSCKQAVGPAGLLSPEFTRLLEGLDVLLPQSLQHKLELQHQHVLLVLRTLSQYIRLKLHSAYGTQEERRKAREEAKRRLERFETHAQEVLRNLEEMLAATRSEAESHLRTFLSDEALKDSVYQKVLNDFPEVDNSNISSARLITAIADEIESQLKSNPKASAFNQCICDADIKLKEEFETKFGAVLKQHNDVIEELLGSPQLPNPFQKVSMFFKETFFKIVFSKAFALAKAIKLSDPTLSTQFWALVDLARSLVKDNLVSPDRTKYIKHLTNRVFGSTTKADAIRSAVEKHLKGPIDYLQACKDAIPRLKQVDEKILQDAETETRPEDEIRRKYEPELDKISILTEELCRFYATNIKKHEFDLAIGKPSDWHLHNEGGQGRIYLVEVSKDGGTFTAAVKIPRQLPSGHLMDFVTEAENLRELKGRHVVKCYGTYCSETNANGTPCLGLVMEYCPKTLDKEMFEKKENSPAWWGSDPEKQAAAFSYTQNLAVQLCAGLKHIHDAGYMHRDLKLINVLVSSEGVVKLADLGSSKSEEEYARTKEGTQFYTAPEVLARKKYNRTADMYSMGVILLEMWYGRTIYYPEDPEYESQFNQAVPLNLGQELPLPSWRGRAPPIPEWWNLINECLRKNTEKRPTAKNCRDRIAGMSLPPTRADAGVRAASEVRLDIPGDDE